MLPDAPSAAVLVSGHVGQIRGDLVGGNKIVHGLTAEQLLDALDARGLLRRAEAGGLEPAAIIAMAQRLRPGERLDIDQALKELDNAVTVALGVIVRGERGTDLGDFVNAVLAEVGRETRVGAHDRSAARIAAALAGLDAAHARSRLALLNEGVNVDTLRRDPVAAASKIEAIVAIESPGTVPAWDDALHRRYHAHVEQGERTGLRIPLEIAAELARRMLATAKGPQQEGLAHHLLGGPLTLLGAAEADGARLQDAIAHFRAAAACYDRAGDTVSRATSLVTLSHALRAAGERDPDITTLHEALKAADEALALLGPASSAVIRATAWMYRGSALGQIGERELGTGSLEAAVEAYRLCFTVFSEASMPEQWAALQINLANVLRLIGQRSGDVGRFREAAEAGRAAIRAVDPETAPILWAEAQVNLGTALLALGEQAGESSALADGIAALEATFRVWQKETAPARWAMAHTNLANAYRMLAAVEVGRGHPEQAIEAARASIAASEASLEVWSEEIDPLRWALAQGNLADGEVLLGSLMRDAGMLHAATLRQRAAIAMLEGAGAEFDQARLQCNLGNALRLLSELDGDVATLRDAEAACEAARKAWPRDRLPLLWAQATENLAVIAAQLGWRLSDPSWLDRARVHFDGAMHEYRKAGAGPRAERLERLRALLDGAGTA